MVLYLIKLRDIPPLKVDTLLSGFVKTLKDEELAKTKSRSPNICGIKGTNIYKSFISIFGDKFANAYMGNMRADIFLTV